MKGRKNSEMWFQTQHKMMMATMIIKKEKKNAEEVHRCGFADGRWEEKSRVGGAKEVRN